MTRPGFLHDVCSAVHPMAVASPVFRALTLKERGVEWVEAPAALAHPLDDGRTALLSRDAVETADSLGRDGKTWLRLVEPFVKQVDSLYADILKPIRWPRDPWLMARFGQVALRSCKQLVRRFHDPPAKALLAGNSAHACLPLSAYGSGSFGLVLVIAGHATGWPCARGGSQRIADALAGVVRAAGGEIHTGVTVHSLVELPRSRAVLFDVTPRQLRAIAGSALSSRYRDQLDRFHYGPGAFKIDYALSAPIPWRSPECARAMTVHLGGTFEEIARNEAAVAGGQLPTSPFVLVAQQSSFDATRAPNGQHTAWAYCHVPNGSHADMTERVERQIDRFAPGFRDVVLERHVMPPAALEAHNPNLVGGDIGGGANSLEQFVMRPVPRWNPYRTSDPRLYLCSSSTPPGGGVHGMCGYWSARSVLVDVFGRRPPAYLEL